MTETVVRIAARGDGVTDGGSHVPFAVPGDVVHEDGTVEPGPHRQMPPCRHFPECGGCQLQHADDDAYRGYLRSRIETALAQHGITAELHEAHLSPPCSRRRATLHALKVGQGVVLGFNAERSHRIVDMRECHVLRPELFALVATIRRLLAGLLEPRRPAEIQMTLVDQGSDLLIRGFKPDGLIAIEALNAFAVEHGLARLAIDSGVGPETFYEPEPATLTLSGTAVQLPIGGFLQATSDGEAVLVDGVRDALAGCHRIADLFAGIGTFALALEHATFAAEASRDAVLAVKRVRPALTAEHRDLYRRPLDKNDLRPFDGIVLDPPRAGAEEQVRQLAASDVGRIAYVSCNPATFSRDAKCLVDGGYRLDWVLPVGQFRWSTHVELVAAFAR